MLALHQAEGNIAAALQPFSGLMYNAEQEKSDQGGRHEEISNDRRPSPRRLLRRRPDGHGPHRTLRRGAGPGPKAKQAHPHRLFLERLRGLQTAGPAVLQQPQVRRLPQQERHPLPRHARRQDRGHRLREVQHQRDADRALRRQERQGDRLDRRLRPPS
jgi:hypothetical protein